MKSMGTENTIWKEKIGQWECSIGKTEGSFFFIVNGEMEGFSGTSSSFEKAKHEVDYLLSRRGLSLPNKKNILPTYHPPAI